MSRLTGVVNSITPIGIGLPSGLMVMGEGGLDLFPFIDMEKRKRIGWLAKLASKGLIKLSGKLLVVEYNWNEASHGMVATQSLLICHRECPVLRSG
jgi:hypothetical protein